MEMPLKEMWKAQLALPNECPFLQFPKYLACSLQILTFPCRPQGECRLKQDGILAEDYLL